MIISVTKYFCKCNGKHQKSLTQKRFIFTLMTMGYINHSCCLFLLTPSHPHHQIQHPLIRPLRLHLILLQYPPETTYIGVIQLYLPVPAMQYLQNLHWRKILSRLPFFRRAETTMEHFFSFPSDLVANQHLFNSCSL